MPRPFIKSRGAGAGGVVGGLVGSNEKENEDSGACRTVVKGDGLPTGPDGVKSTSALDAPTQGTTGSGRMRSRRKAV